MVAIVFLILCWVIPVNVEELSPAKVTWMKVMAYCPCKKCCGQSARGLTSTGKDATKPPFGAAADPKILPYGTKIEIPGVGIREVDDTGGAMRKNAKKGIYHIDVRFATHQEALEFGVQWLEVKILPNQQARSH